MVMQNELDFPPGGFVGLWAYDAGNDKWYAVVADSSGYLLVKIDESALPTGAAIAAHQVTQITALHSIQNLVGALGDVALDELRINIIGAGNADRTAADVLLTEIQDRLGDETSPAAGTVNKQLADILAKQVLLDSGVQVRRGNHVVVPYSGVPGDTSAHELVNVSGVGVLEWAHVASDHASSYFQIFVDGDSVYTIDPSGPTLRSQIRPIYLQYGEKKDGLFMLVCYDAGNGHFGTSLRRPLWFNSTLVVNYGAGSVTADVRVACGYHLA